MDVHHAANSALHQPLLSVRQVAEANRFMNRQGEQYTKHRKVRHRGQAERAPACVFDRIDAHNRVSTRTRQTRRSGGGNEVPVEAVWSDRSVETLPGHSVSVPHMRVDTRVDARLRVADTGRMDPTSRVSRSALARSVGIAEATLRSWQRRGFVPDKDGLVSLEDLLAFCRSNRSLPAARALLQRTPPLEYVADSSGPSEASTAQNDPEAARAVARATRTASLAIFDALLKAAKAAEDAARAQRETLEDLRRAFAATDDALIHLTSPSTLND